MSKFILGDCMDPETGLPSYPDNYFDLAIVDPPYGIDEKLYRTSYGKLRKSNISEYSKKRWDKKRPNKLYFHHLIRCSKNQIVWGGNYFTEHLPPSMGWIFWDKKITNASNTNFSDGELAFSSFNQRLVKVTIDWIGFGYLNNPYKERKIHPTQKPVALYCWLLENYAKPGDLILDTHVGSASSLIACESMGFEYVGYEIDPDYYAAAKNRMSKGIQLVIQ